MINGDSRGLRRDQGVLCPYGGQGRTKGCQVPMRDKGEPRGHENQGDPEGLGRTKEGYGGGCGLPYPPWFPLPLMVTP